MPISWKKLDSIFPTDYNILTISKIIRSDGPWQNILSDKQDLKKIISEIKEIV
jgi:DNA primase